MIDNNKKGTFGDALSKTGGAIFNKTLGRLFGAGLPIGGESTQDRMMARARWTRSEASDFRVKVVLPSNSPLMIEFFGGTKDSVKSQLLTDWDTQTTSGSNNPILSPLADSGGVIFPITPGIIINHTASYSPLICHIVTILIMHIIIAKYRVSQLQQNFLYKTPMMHDIG